MSQKGIEQLIGKALADQKFLEGFLKNPEAEIKKAGLDILPEELAQIKTIDSAKAKQFAMAFADEFSNRQQAQPFPGI